MVEPSVLKRVFQIKDHLVLIFSYIQTYNWTWKSVCNLPTNIKDPGDPQWVKLSWWHSILKIVFSDDIELTTHEKSLLQKCLNLIHHRFPSVFHQQNYMTSNNTTTKTINEQGNLSKTQNRVIRKDIRSWLKHSLNL